MPRRVFFRISDRSDGLFDAITTIEPDTVIRRDGFASLAEAEEWVEGLRILMAALGAPVAQADGAGTADTTRRSEDVPGESSEPGRLRTAR